LVIAKQSYFLQVSNHKFGGLHQTNVENFSSQPPCSFFTPQRAQKYPENTFLSFGKIYTKKILKTLTQYSLGTFFQTVVNTGEDLKYLYEVKKPIT
jgi:hypothetical protein